MKDILIKWFMLLNILVLRTSRGRIRSKLGRQTILILHFGRKSGKDRAIPIAYFETEGILWIVALNWGKERQVNLYLNLKHEPHARLEINGKTIPDQAREAQGEEYDRLWTFATQQYSQYLKYQQMTNRHIPIMVLEQVWTRIMFILASTHKIEPTFFK